MSADVAPLAAVRVLKWWKFRGHLPGGGCIAGGGGAPVERLMRALVVERLAEASKRALLSPSSAGWRACGVRLQRALQAFMAAVLLGFTKLDARGADTPADPLGGTS